MPSLCYSSDTLPGPPTKQRSIHRILKSKQPEEQEVVARQLDQGPDEVVQEMAHALLQQALGEFAQQIHLLPWASSAYVKGFVLQESFQSFAASPVSPNKFGF